MSDELPFGLDKITQSMSRLNLKGGLASKICYVLIFSSLAIAAIAWSVRLVWVSALSLAMIFTLIVIFLWRLINLAEKHPQSALMEGAEFLIHEQLMMGTKQEPAILVSESDMVERAPILLTQAEKKTLEQPDQEQLPSGPTSGKEEG